MKISISGYGGCGKDYVASLISKYWNLAYKHSTSYTAAEFVFHKFQNSMEHNNRFSNKDDCYEKRKDWRKFWAEAIEEYNQYNRAQLYIDHLALGQDIATGIRKEIELNACKHFKVFDVYIWVNRPGFSSTDSTQEYNERECDFILINDHRVEERIKNLSSIFRMP